MTTTLQLLALFSFQMTIGPPLGSLFKAIGRPDFSTKLALIRGLLLAILLIPATNAYGIEGAAGVVVFIGLIVMLPIDAYLLVEHSLDTTYKRFFSEIAYPFTASTLMFAAVALFSEAVPFTRSLVEFFVLVIVGVLAYGAAVGLLIVVANWNIIENFRWLRETAARGS